MDVDSNGDKLDAQVVYSVRELLEQIRTDQTVGFARLEVSLAAKADKADVARLEARLDRHEVRLGQLEDRDHETELRQKLQAKEHERQWSVKRKVLAGLASLGMILATIFGPYVGTHL